MKQHLCSSKGLLFNPCFLGLLIGLCFFSSCSHYYYGPNFHNVPIFKQKNEARLSGNASTADEVGAFNVQAAYSPTKEVGVLANAYVANADMSTKRSPSGGKGQLYELGAGYFKPLGRNDSNWVKGKFVFEAYGVLGMGSAKNWYKNPYPINWYLRTNLFKAYVQTSLSFATNIVDITFSQKIGLVHTFGIKCTIPDSLVAASAQAQNEETYRPTLVNDLRILNAHRTMFIYEPAFMLRFGFQYAKFHFQLGGSVMNTAFSRLNYGMHGDIGVTFSFARRFLEKHDPNRKKWRILFD